MHIELGAVKKRSGIDMEMFKSLFHPVGPKNNQCWNWVGPFYGPAVFQSSSSKAKLPAHKWIFETMIGSLPDRIVLMPDENCTLSNEVPRGNKHPVRGHCVNPDHYYAMTPLDAYRLDFGSAAKTECAQGHPFSQDTVTYSVQSRQIFCRYCQGGLTWKAEEEKKSEGTEDSLVSEVVPEVSTPAPVEEQRVEEKELVGAGAPATSASTGSTASSGDIRDKWMSKPTGEPLAYTNDDFDRFMAHTETRGPKDCLVWTGTISPTQTGGVPQPWFIPTGEHRVRAYRWLFEVTYGTFDPADHILLMEEPGCELMCVHADHRIPCDRSYYSAHRPRVRPRTQCINGHPYVDGSYRISARGTRVCLVCDRNWKDNRKAQQRSERWIRWVDNSSQEELNSLVEDMPQGDYYDLTDQMHKWIDENSADPAVVKKVEIAVDNRLKKEEPELYPTEEAQQTQPEENPLWLDWILNQNASTKAIRDLGPDSWLALLISFESQDPDELNETTRHQYERVKAAVGYRQELDKVEARSRQRETIPVLNNETQLDPDAVKMKDTVVYTPQTGLCMVNGVVQRMTRDELVERLHLAGLTSDVVDETLDRVESRGRFLAPWLYADKVIDMPDEPEPEEVVPDLLVVENEIAPEDEAYTDEEEEISNEAFLKALREIQTTNTEMVPFTISAKVPLNLAGATMLQILSALADADATEVRFKK